VHDSTDSGNRPRRRGVQGCLFAAADAPSLPAGGAPLSVGAVILGDDVGERRGMKKRPRVIAAFLLAILLCGYMLSAEAQAPLRCGPFIQGELSPPAPRQNGHARARFEQINADVKNQPHRVLFLGDSLTEGFDREVWEQ